MAEAKGNMKPREVVDVLAVLNMGDTRAGVCGWK